MNRTLLDLKKGEKAEVVALPGGHTMCRRLEGMGIRQGKIVSRISSQLMGGPVVISVDGRQTAMGRRMAGKIQVKPTEDNGEAVR